MSNCFQWNSKVKIIVLAYHSNVAISTKLKNTQTVYFFKMDIMQHSGFELSIALDGLSLLSRTLHRP